MSVAATIFRVESGSDQLGWSRAIRQWLDLSFSTCVASCKPASIPRFLATSQCYGYDARFIFLNIQGREMVSGDTLDPVGAAQRAQGLCAAGGHRARASLLDGGIGGSGRKVGSANMNPQGGMA
ncbi:MAG TPA: hypothetical protein VMJ11_14950 [Paraburkholderia sp.]|uniref:hypothetical protein n=1 Tax=Paraburkholderia sp. TaxID=1926495 RepID=UPI002C6D8534|nr:hypothetical protein [Paraburkholderia sp.]HTR07915.1 hypothetical protein [Paraburkholderia sp.]